jgi:membrane protein YqaA with SNARE-associated domain
MKKKTYQFLVVTLSLLMMLAASCGRENDFADPSPMTASADTAASTFDGIADEPVAEPTESNGATLTLHGLVCRAGEILLVHPEPWRVFDPADVDPADCLEIPLAGVSLTEAMPPLPIEDIAEIRVGDFVRVQYSEKMESANRPKKVYSVALCQNITEQRTVSQVSAGLNRIILGGTKISRSIFDAGKVLDASGKPVAFEEVSVGDLFEVQHGGEILQSAPSQFGHLHVVRRIKTAAQIEADRAAQAALDALTRKVVLRGTVREFGVSKLVWLGETVAPEEINYFACTSISTKNAVITDAATGQALTWDDLQDGDYVAVETNGVIAETAPGQMHTVYSVTRLRRLCLAGTVSGSCFALFLAKKFGGNLIYAICPKEKMDSISFLHDAKKRNFLTYTLFFMPGTPKDVLTYAVGLTDMSILRYVALTTFARIPSILMSTVSGDWINNSLLGKGSIWPIIILNGVSLLLCLAGYIIYMLINRKHAKRLEKKGQKIGQNSESQVFEK